MKEKFIEFLKTHKAHSGYVRNAKTDHNTTLDNIAKNWKNRPQNWIGCAFDWDKTPEGRDYWGNLDASWKKELFFRLNY